MKWNKFIFFGLVVLAFTLRAIYFNQTSRFIQPGSGSDSFFYLQWAEDIVRGNILGRGVFYALPVYPYFLSLAYLFSGGETFGLLLIQLLIGSLSCGLIYILGKRLFSQQVGIIAAIIACAYAMFIFYDRMLLPTSLAIFLGLLLALLLLKVKHKPSLKLWIASGLLLGLCTLTSASFSLLAVFIALWIIFVYMRSSIKQALLYCGCFILPFFLIIGAVTLRNYLVANDPVLITAHSGINFYIGNNPASDGLFKAPAYMRPTQDGLVEDAHILAERISGRRLKASEASRFWFRRSLNFARNRPLDYLRLLAKKFALFFNGAEHIDDIEYYIFAEEANFFKLPFFRFSLICPLAILGLVLSWPNRARIMPAYLFVLALSSATISFFINSRYRLIVLPFLIIFAASGFWQIVNMFKARRFRSLVFSLVLFFGLYFLANIELSDVSGQPIFTLHYNKGIYFSDQKEYAQAIKEFQAALVAQPFDFMSYLGLGNVHYQMQEFSQAIDNYQRALKINPYFVKAHFNLGLTYEQMGKDKQAEEHFKAVIELKPQDYAALYNLGIVYQKQGLNDLALEAYQQALKINPKHPEILQAIEEIKQVQ